MKQTLITLIALLAAAAYVGRPVKGADTLKEQTYVRIPYCYDTQSVTDQRHSGKHKLVLGYSLSSTDPNSEEMKACEKVGSLMIGYVQISPPIANPE